MVGLFSLFGGGGVHIPVVQGITGGVVHGVFIPGQQHKVLALRRGNGTGGEEERSGELMIGCAVFVGKLRLELGGNDVVERERDMVEGGGLFAGKTAAVKC